MAQIHPRGLLGQVLVVADEPRDAVRHGNGVVNNGGRLA